jgi:dTDP-4-amino-4,6-dideoxygalactose transaminase
LGETIFEPDFLIRQISIINKKVIERIYERYHKIKSMRLQIINNYQATFLKFQDSIVIYPVKNCYRFPILIKNIAMRKELLNALTKLGLKGLILYPNTLNKQLNLDVLLNDKNDYINAEYISNHLITLPVNEYVNQSLIENIKNTFVRVIKF